MENTGTPGSLVSISCVDTWTVKLTSSVPGGYYPQMGTVYEWSKSDSIVRALTQGAPKAHSLVILRSAWISFWLCVPRPKLITYHSSLQRSSLYPHWLQGMKMTSQFDNTLSVRFAVECTAYGIMTFKRNWTLKKTVNGVNGICSKWVSDLVLLVCK